MIVMSNHAEKTVSVKPPVFMRLSISKEILADVFRLDKNLQTLEDVAGLIKRTCFPEYVVELLPDGSYNDFDLAFQLNTYSATKRSVLVLNVTEVYGKKLKVPVCVWSRRIAWIEPETTNTKQPKNSKQEPDNNKKTKPKKKKKKKVKQHAKE